MSPAKCEQKIASLGFEKCHEGSRMIQLRNHMVPFVSWRLGDFQVEVYYFWPYRQYPEEVVDDINRLNGESVASAAEYAPAHEVLLLCS